MQSLVQALAIVGLLGLAALLALLQPQQWSVVAFYALLIAGDLMCNWRSKPRDDRDDEPPDEFPRLAG